MAKNVPGPAVAMAKQPLPKLSVHYAAGDVVYEEGETGATMYIVQAGQVELYRVVDGERRGLGILEKGDFFGEMSVLEGLPRPTCARAVEDADLLEINTTTFDRMIRGNIEIAVRLLRKLSLRLREAQRRLDDLALTGTARPTRAAAPAAARPPATLPAAVGGARLELPEEQGSAFPLRGNEMLIGRYDPVTEMRPDVDLTPVDLKRSVSRRHVRVVRTGDQFTAIEEVGALNGTWVNGTRLVTGRPQPLADGDRLEVGMVKLVFHAS